MSAPLARDELKPAARGWLVVTSDNTWGKGPTAKEAAANAVKAGARKSARCTLFAYDCPHAELAVADDMFLTRPGDSQVLIELPLRSVGSLLFPA